MVCGLLCVGQVFNEVGSAVSGAATLVVIAPPVVSPLTDVAAKIGVSVTLSITATATGTLTYQWYTTTGPIAGKTTASFTFTVALGVSPCVWCMWFRAVQGLMYVRRDGEGAALGEWD